MYGVISSISLLVSIFPFISGLYFYIGETKRKCFIEEVPEDTTVIVSYRAEFYDPRTGGVMNSNEAIGIYVEVKDPDMKIILSRVYSSKSKLLFISQIPGEHIICLNPHSAKWIGGTQLRVHFNIQVGEHAFDYANVAKKENLNDFQLRMTQLLNQVEAITNEQIYQRDQEERFRQTSETTNLRVFWWSIAQLVILIAMGTWQMMHLNSSSEAKKLLPMEDTKENIRRLTGNPNVVLQFPEIYPTDKSVLRYCGQCGAGFYSDSCKEQSWVQYNECLCFGTYAGLKNLYKARKPMLYPPETASVTSIARMIAMIEQARGKDSAISPFIEFVHDTTEERDGSVLKFLGEKFECLQLLMSDIFHTCHAQSKEGLKTLFAIAGRNSQGIGTSAFSIWVKNIEKFELSEESRKEVREFIDNVYLDMDHHVGYFLNNEGSGVYRFERSITNSCLPNASSTLSNNDYPSALVAETPISDGEEIGISYLDECELEQRKHSQKEHLRECERCLKQSDEPNVTSEEENLYLS